MKKILIVEDEKNTIKALSTALQLEDEGYKITSTENGQSGIGGCPRIGFLSNLFKV